MCWCSDNTNPRTLIIQPNRLWYDIVTPQPLLPSRDRNPDEYARCDLVNVLRPIRKDLHRNWASKYIPFSFDRTRLKQRHPAVTSLLKRFLITLNQFHAVTGCGLVHLGRQGSASRIVLTHNLLVEAEQASKDGSKDGNM